MARLAEYSSGQQKKIRKALSKKFQEQGVNPQELEHVLEHTDVIREGGGSGIQAVYEYGEHKVRIDLPDYFINGTVDRCLMFIVGAAVLAGGVILGGMGRDRERLNDGR